MTGWRHRGAFLVDVLVAFGILSVGLLALAGLFWTAGRSEHELACRETAAYLAQDRLEQLRLGGCGGDWSGVDLLAEAGVETLWRDGRQYVRTTEWQSRPDLDAAGHLLESAVQVTWREGAGQRSVLLVTYFAVDTELENLR